jgi:hypothetical protein
LPGGRLGRGARRWSTRLKTTRTRISSPQIIGQAGAAIRGGGEVDQLPLICRLSIKVIH